MKESSSFAEKLASIKIRYPVDLTVGIVFAALGLAIRAIIPSQVVISEKDVVNGRAFPELLAMLMLFCSALLIAREVFKLATHRPVEWKELNLWTEFKALCIFAIFVGFFLLAKLTNWFLVGAIFCCLGFLIYFRCRKPLYYVITLTFAVAIWAAFRFVLHVDF